MEPELCADSRGSQPGPVVTFLHSYTNSALHSLWGRGWGQQEPASHPQTPPHSLHGHTHIGVHSELGVNGLWATNHLKQGSMAETSNSLP